MGARGIDGRVAPLVLSLVLGCGGISTRGRAEESSAGSSGASGSGAGLGGGGSASDGGGSTVGGQGNGGTPSWLVDLSLGTAFPWFKQEHGGSYDMIAAAQSGVLHVVFEGSPVEWTLSTHNHLAVLGVAHGITFNIRSNAARVVRLSVKSTLDADFFAARDRGDDWPVAPLQVAPEWRDFHLSFDELMPPEQNPGTDGPAFTVAFVVEEKAGPVELWLTDVHFL